MLPCAPSIWKMNCLGPRFCRALANRSGAQGVFSAWKLSCTRWNGSMISVGNVMSPRSRSRAHRPQRWSERLSLASGLMVLNHLRLGKRGFPSWLAEARMPHSTNGWVSEISTSLLKSVPSSGPVMVTRSSMVYPCFMRAMWCVSQ